MSEERPDMKLGLVESDASWQAYHNIRRHVLFELRGRNDYDERIPDDYKSGNFPFLFEVNDRPIATVRLDTDSHDMSHGIVRLVAVLPEFQRKGVGKAMMNEVEIVAALRGMKHLSVNAAYDAVRFYEKLNWQMVDTTRRSPLMSKQILGPIDALRLL